MRARGDLAALDDRHALPRDGPLLHHEGDEPALGPFVLDPAQLLDAGEVLVERAHPAEPGGDRVRVRSDVVAVQRVADLEPETVARAEPARRDAALEHRIPELAGLVGHRHQLDALLAGVAGAVDHAGDAADLALGERERRRRVQPEPLERARPLHGDQAVLVGDVAHVGARAPRAPSATRSRPRGSTR